MRRALALLLGLSACRNAQNIVSPAGPAAGTIAGLWWVAVVVLGAAAVVTCALLAAGAVRKRGTLAEHESAFAGGGLNWVVYGGLVVPLVVLAGLFVMTLQASNSFPVHTADDDHGHVKPDIRVIAHQWWWEVQYLGTGPETITTTANELHLPVGWPVEVELVSRDVIHSFWVPQLHGKVDLIPGRENHVRLQADRAGAFEGQCAEFCGAEHARMRLLVVAEPYEDFKRWLGHEAQTAVAQLDPEEQQGQALFQQKACSLCHTIRGTGALGSVGPDLTHLASRSGIAANSLPNQHAWLQAWVVRAQSLKPGAQMPDVDDFTGPELRALTQYLLALK